MARPQTVLNVLAVILLAAGCSQEPAATQSAAEPQAPAQTAGPYRGAVEGVVADSAGKPVAGAFVRLRNPERRLTFLVVSQDEGRYAARQLPAGNYTVEGVGGDFQSAAAAPVAVPAEGAAKVDVSLTQQRAPLLPAAWPRRVPEEQANLDALPDHPAKQIITTKCVFCHSGSMIVANRFERAAWQSSIEEMREMARGSGYADLTDAEHKQLVDYLVANLPPMAAPDPNSRFPRELMQGDARKYRVVQYDLEDKGAETHDVAVDPWGVGWANQRIGGKISRFDPVTYEYREIGPPLTHAKRARPGNLQIGTDGIMWLADPFETRWLSYDIKADKWTSYPFPTDKIRGQVQGNTVALHQDGTIWMAGPGSARRLDPKTGEFTAWDTPTWTRTKRNPGGYGMTVAGDGRVWMAMNLVDKMARFDAKTGKVDEFSFPAEGVLYPRRMDTDWNGDVWVGLWQAGKLVKIDHKTAEMTVIDPPTPQNGAYMISADHKNKLLWMTLHKVDTIARCNPETKEWVQFPMPQAETDVRRIEVDPNNTNRIWWSTTANDARIGYMELVE